jgi:paired amphipathic helix protein Sin3a
MRTEIQIFKKDDTTFDLDVMSEANRWHYYISSYTNVEPTEGVSTIRTHTAVMRRNLPDTSVPSSAPTPVNADSGSNTAAEDTTAADKAGAEAKADHEMRERIDHLRSKEALEMRICTRTYTPLFWPGGEDMIFQPSAFPSHLPQIKPSTEDVASATGQIEGSGDGEVPQAAAAASTGEEEDEEAHAEPKEVFKEKLVMNSAWMKGLSKEEVDEFNGQLRELKGAGPAAVPVDEDMDA